MRDFASFFEGRFTGTAVERAAPESGNEVGVGPGGYWGSLSVLYPPYRCYTSDLFI